jgi:hypothetical protein
LEVKTQINKEEDYNDGLYQQENSEDSKKIKGNGWHQRILLPVEKERMARVLAEKKVKKKRNALLTRYFQQRLLFTINEKLKCSAIVLSEQLQIRENCIELLVELLTKEPDYIKLAELLELNPSTRNHVINLVSNSDFMALLGKDKYILSDAKSAIGLIGVDILRYLIPTLIFKYRINTFNQHSRFFAKKLWRYQLTLAQACTVLMKESGYDKPYEGQLLSAISNFAYTASFQQYLESFESVRGSCIAEAREKGDKPKHDFFFDIKSDPASLQALLISKADLKMSILLANEAFSQQFSHLLNALNEEVEHVDFSLRSPLGKILFQATHFAKYDQLRASRLFKAEWLDAYLNFAQIDSNTFKNLSRQELFRFKSDW